MTLRCQIDLASLPDAAIGVELLTGDVPGELAHPIVQQLVRQALPDVEQHHERRPAAADHVHVYRHDDAWAVGRARSDARDVVRVSGAGGQRLWDNVCAVAQDWELSGQPPTR